MHQDAFGAFIDIAGDLSPNVGTRDQSIDRLYGGNADAWSAFDPSTVIAGHGVYRDLSGRFIVPTTVQSTSDGYLHAARTLCELGRSRGIGCEVLARPGRHVWPFAAAAFADSLPWLAAEVDMDGAMVDRRS